MLTKTCWVQPALTLIRFRSKVCAWTKPVRNKSVRRQRTPDKTPQSVVRTTLRYKIDTMSDEVTNESLQESQQETQPESQPESPDEPRMPLPPPTFLFLV